MPDDDRHRRGSADRDHWFRPSQAPIAATVGVFHFPPLKGNKPTEWKTRYRHEQPVGISGNGSRLGLELPAQEGLDDLDGFRCVDLCKGDLDAPEQEKEETAKKKVKKKRAYGCYVLPVLYGDRLVARMDPEFDRASRIFTLKNWWWEKEVDKKDEVMLAAIGDCLAAFGKYLEANEIRLEPDVKREPGLAKAVER